MSIRNLDQLFNPKSIAVIGASPDTASIGGILTRNLQRGGFGGEVMLVNPRHSKINLAPVYSSLSELPSSPDLAIICTPADTVPALISELGVMGTKGALVISSGFGEGADRFGSDLRAALLAGAKPHLLRLIGPNCLGILLPRLGIDATFAHVPANQGSLAFVTQSGAIVTAMLDWAKERDIGFTHIVSLGDMLDVDFGDMLDYLANDTHTRAILLYIEAIKSARKFMSAARAASRMKPVIVVKAGRFEEGAKAAASHTGALTGSDDVYDAVFRRAGMLRVDTLEELFDAAETLAMAQRRIGDRLAILTNGGGIGVLATDALNAQGGMLAQLTQKTVDELDTILPGSWSRGNPVDILGDATGRRYQDALRIIATDKNIDAVLVLNCPTAIASSKESAQAIADIIDELGRIQVLTNWVGDVSNAKARPIFHAHRIPSFDTPEQAITAFMHLVNYHRNQEALMETPVSVPEEFVPKTDSAREIIQAVLDAGKKWLTEPEAKDILIAYGIATAHVHTAATPDQAAACAADLGGAVVLKILSPAILHKSDVDGVALDLVGPQAVKEAAQRMLQSVTEQLPDAEIAGFSVQAMVRRPDAYELFVGMKNDTQFGPVIVFGHGGTAVEIINDKAVGLPPLNMHLAKEQIFRTRISRLFSGFRNQPPINLDALAMTLIKISQLIVDIPEIEELDINPLLADQFGVIALDARIRIGTTTVDNIQRLAIRPYPKEIEESITLGDGRRLFLRPILPEDEPAMHAAFAKLTPEEIRLRFFVPMRTLSHVMAARFTQIDYDREMALVLTEKGIPGTTELYGVVRISAEPDNEKAEYAIIVRHDMAGLGLGIFLMRRIIDYASRRGIKQIFGEVLKDNVTMLKLCDHMGFVRSSVPHDHTITQVTLDLA